MHRVIISCYFALTTLSTVGYGDYFPISNFERVFAILIMLFGVAFFSFIMGNLIYILEEIQNITNFEKKTGSEDKSGALYNWLVLLERFNNNNPLSGELNNQINANFIYYWANDRLSYINSDNNNL
jgi:hypothetical protein